ncbi:trypsin-like serine peptidase [Mesorhizobium sp. L48C026A00]|uniref:trypsin-like serine peptidase n=1 Tax=Mesorhizobium sp. L48C026A00 TaxID=1287182 RepID=UPI0004CFDE8D|nr:trypsin-like peptidase domain-containing protein [Mesorhizobium sp. L48C026A00]
MTNEATLRAQRRSWTCAFEDFAGVYGTGALIGPDLVLTNYHVVERLEKNAARQAAARVRFDYFAPGTGRVVVLAQDWLVAKSFYSWRDLDPTRDVEPDKLDYAVVRIAEKVGDGPPAEGVAAGWRYVGRPARRGWLVLPKPETRVEKGTPIDIYHHPCVVEGGQVSSCAMPDLPARGTILSVDAGWLRVTHNAETRHGSSGAICYGKNLDPVALHHAGDPDSALETVTPDQKPLPPGQRAIPLGLVAAQLLASFPKIYQETLPPKENPAQVAVAKSTAEIGQGLLRDRHARALPLVDRDRPEWDIIDSRAVQKSLVHAIGCRTADGQKFFMTRLRQASFAFEGLSRAERNDRLSELLKSGRSQNGWAGSSPIVDTQLDPIGAAAKIAREIEWKIDPGQGTVFVIGTTFAKRPDFEREKIMVAEVGRLCVPLTAKGKFQVIFVYEDTRPNSRGGSGVAGFWRNPPPDGCGRCLDLTDIARDQLDEWIKAIDHAYKIDRDALSNEIDRIFRLGPMPFAAIEPKLRRVTSIYCRDTK